MLWIGQEWQKYAEHVLPQGAMPIQVQETRRAFYAGANALFHTIVMKISGGEEITEADLEIMSDIHNELNNFGIDVTKGRK